MKLAPNSGKAAPKKPISRRHVISVGAAFFASGCSLPPVFGNAIGAAQLLVSGAPDTPISPEYVDNLPYASMAAKIGRGPRVLLVLGRFDGPDLHWISADNTAVVTRNGRVTKTTQIGRDLLDTQGIEDDPVATGNMAFEGTHDRTVDLRDPSEVFGIPITSTFRIVARETIKILDREIDTLKVEERNIASTVRWEFENMYWFDFQSGFLWKSVQHFARNTPPIELDILKPAKIT